MRRAETLALLSPQLHAVAPPWYSLSPVLPVRLVLHERSVPVLLESNS